MSDKNFDPGMNDTCELKEAWADGKKLYYVEDIPGLLEQIANLNKQLAEANVCVAEVETRKEALEESLNGCTNKVLSLSQQLELTTLTTHEASFESDYGQKRLSKFAIEKKIEAINEALDYYEELKASEEPIGAGSILHVCLGRLISQQKQLRKEQK